VFGGEVIGQAVQAAQRPGEGKEAHSLHAYFMRPGNEDFPIVYRVVRDFEGRSFATRRVIAMQKGQPILNMAASFQAPAEGLNHQDAMPDVPAPEELRSEAELREEIREQVPEKLQRFFLRARPIEIRPVNPRNWFAPTPQEPVQHSWFRVVAPLPDDPALHRAVLAYASDYTILEACLRRNGLYWADSRLRPASLDHAMWFHRPARADDWVLYTQSSPSGQNGRGLGLGRMFAADGTMVATVAQEGMIRIKED